MRRHPWEEHHNQLQRADRLRAELHRPRLHGIAAALLAGVLALAVLRIGAFGRSSLAGTSVVVV